MNIEQAMLAWQLAAANVESAKSHELRLRKMIIKELFNVDENNLNKGTRTLDLPRPGYKFRAKFNINYSIEVDKMAGVVHDMRMTDPEGMVLANDLIKIVPTLVPSVYENLPPRFKRLADTAVISKPATPSLELIIPEHEPLI